MKSNIKNFKNIVFFVITLFSLVGVNAQATQTQDLIITGEENPIVGDSEIYTLSGTYVLSTVKWFETDAKIQIIGNNQATTTINVDVLSAGQSKLYVEYEDSMFDLYWNELLLNITAVAPEPPTLSTVTQPTCTTATGSFTITNYNTSNSYAVTPSTGVIISGANVIAPAGSYTLTATANNLTSVPSTSITVNVQPSTPSPPLVGTITQPTETVATGSVNLTGLPSGSWTINPGNLSGSGSSYTLENLTASSTYNFTVTNASGCTSAPTSDVVIGTQPLGCGLADENYVYSIVPREPVTDISQIIEDDNKIESISYFDGLGRPMQSIGIRAGGNSEDIVTHIGYDDYGRQTQDYLPYAVTNSCGRYQQDAEYDTRNYYDNAVRYDDDFVGMDITNINPFSEKDLEASPLSRVLKQAAPGADWGLGEGHEIEFDYQTNAIDEVKNYRVELTLVTANAGNYYNPKLILSTANNGFYAPNMLYKTITKDENHDVSSSKPKLHTTEEFKDKQGRVVLKRTYSETDAAGDLSAQEVAHDTYYVYDDYSNLTYVLSPKMDASINPLTTVKSKLDKLGYQYTYDYRNRLIVKQIPGKKPEHIVYDKLDRPVFTQDKNLLDQGIWLFTKYDVFGRVAYTGKYTSSKTRKQLQLAVKNSAAIYESRLADATDALGYTNDVITTDVANMEVLTINYYDDYDFDIGLGTKKYAFNVYPTDKVKGLATGSKVKVLDLAEDKWITTITYYDEKSRPIYIYSNNEYLLTTDEIENRVNFTGQITRSRVKHKKGNNAVLTTDDYYTYDHMDRLVKQTQIINNQGGVNEEIIVKNSYDELGMLIKKSVGGKKGAAQQLQDVDYAYNIRGWLKEVNDSDWLGNDLFAFKINYNTITALGTNPSNLNTEPLFNGNISETIWRTASDNKKRGYGYKYDALNRITAGTYKAGNWFSDEQHFFNLKNMSYDKNGNILKLERNAPNDTFTQYEETDNLVYKYNTGGNQLTKVTDTKSETLNSMGFIDVDISGVADYIYDKNGNMKRDKNKGITSITYNHLNLPKKVSINDGGANVGDIEYIYDATGVKLKKIVSTGSTTTYSGNYIYENMGTGDVLKFFNHPEGYIELKDVTNISSGFNYIYQYKDHLGNVRLSYSDNNGDGDIDVSTDPMINEILEENNYYPFGLKHKGYNNNPVTNHKYELYNGKEYEESLGLNLYEMDVRSYDPAIARWTTIDPVTHHSQSTYTGFDNNPIFWSDPSGADVEEFAWGTRYTGADAQSMFGKLKSQYGSSNNDKSDDNQSTQPKYQIYGVTPTGEKMNLNYKGEFNVLTAYGDDPADVRKAKWSKLKDFFRVLPRKEQVALLRALKIPSKHWVGIIEKYGKVGKIFKVASGARIMPNYDVYDEGLAALPLVFGLPFQSVNDDFHSGARAIENELMWDDVLFSFDRMMGTEVLNDVIIIYSNQNLFKQSTINTSDAEYLNNREATGNYRYAYYGTQDGNNLYIFGMYLTNND